MLELKYLPQLTQRALTTVNSQKLTVFKLKHHQQTCKNWFSQESKYCVAIISKKLYLFIVLHSSNNSY